MMNQVTDHGMLGPTMEGIRSDTPGEVLDVVADKGYEDEKDIIKCLEERSHYRDKSRRCTSESEVHPGSGNRWKAGTNLRDPGGDAGTGKGGRFCQGSGVEPGLLPGSGVV